MTCTTCRGVGTLRTLRIHPLVPGHMVNVGNTCAACGGWGKIPERPIIDGKTRAAGKD